MATGEEICKRLGLVSGQMKVMANWGHNSNWFAKDGQWIGFGDLTFDDVMRIRRSLWPLEVFFVLSERVPDENGGYRHGQAMPIDLLCKLCNYFVTSEGIFGVEGAREKGVARIVPQREVKAFIYGP